MDEIDRSDLNTGRKTPGIRMRIALALIIIFLLSVLALYFSSFLGQDARDETVLGNTTKFVSRFPGQNAWYETVLGNTTKIVEIVSRMRINLLKSNDLEKGAVMAITDEESQALAEQSRKSADAVERDYHELKGLIDTAKIDKEMNLLKEFNDNWKKLRVIDRELLSLAVENTNIKAANLSSTSAAQVIADFERLLSTLMDIPTSDGERAQMAKLAYQAVTAAFMIYSLEAPHINEAQDKKMDELETLMGMNEKKARTALRNISRLTDRHGRIILDDASLAFSKFMEVNKEVVRLSRMNTNIKSLQLSLGRKRNVAAQCEEILNSLQDTVQTGRSFKATR
jgi:Four helix bundle sensory module for signal transduction